MRASSVRHFSVRGEPSARHGPSRGDAATWIAGRWPAESVSAGRWPAGTCISDTPAHPSRQS